MFPALSLAALQLNIDCSHIVRFFSDMLSFLAPRYRGSYEHSRHRSRAIARVEQDVQNFPAAEVVVDAVAGKQKSIELVAKVGGGAKGFNLELAQCFADHISKPEWDFQGFGNV